MNRLEEIFNVLQDLDMKPTPHNVSIMDGVYGLLREIYKEMEDKQNAGTENGTASDPDGRNAD